MNTTLLYSFVKVADYGSVSVAAVHLSRTQSTLSKHITALEKELGVRLFYRDGRGVSLTESGQHFYPRAIRILNELEQALLEAGESSDNPVKNLVIALPPTIAKVITLPFTDRVTEAMPNTKLRFVEGFSNHILDWLGAGTVDVAVLYDSSATSRFNTERLLVEELWFIAAKKHYPRLPDTLTFAELVKYPMILPGSSHGLRNLINRCCDIAQTDLNTHIEVESFASIVDLVAEGHGCTILPLLPLKDHVTGGVLKAARITEPQINRTLLLATQETRIPGFAMKQIVKILKETIHEYARF